MTNFERPLGEIFEIATGESLKVTETKEEESCDKCFWGIMDGAGCNDKFGESGYCHADFRTDNKHVNFELQN